MTEEETSRTLSSSKATAASLGDVSSHVDIETLVDYIPEMASQWMFLGTKLGQNKLVKSLKKREANDNEKCYEILENWIEGEENPSLEKFLIAMESPAVNLIGLSKKIKKDYGLLTPTSRKSNPATGRGKSNRPIDLAATDLEDKLQWIKNNEHRLVWETEKVRDEKMKRVIDEYFTSLETDLADLDLDEMKKNVEEFYDDGLLSSEAYKHAYKKYVDLKNASAPVMKKDTNGCKKEEVLFSKENVYLSLICCKALDSSQNISTFLKTDSNCCRHKFERVSKSRGESSLLIAKKRESSVYFVACRVQSHWNERKLFEYLQRIPTNMFMQWLRDGMQLILTGFSYGGSLACAAFAGMLQGNFSNQESLASNVCCITFGQPLECSPALEDEIRQREKLKCCFNRIYLEAEYARHANRLLSRLGYDIDQLQDITFTGGDPVIIFESNRSIVASGQYYVISTSSESESQWKSLNEKEFTSALKKVSESLTRSSQEKNVHLEDYFKKVFVAYIDHPPVYMLPPQRNDNVPSNDMLPVVDSVEMHCYDKDICAIVSGTNLWFAESVKVYEVTTQLCIRENTGLQFQFQMNREKIERQGFLLKKHPEKISLQLETAFDDAVVRSVPVEIKNYEMTVRQIQLAKVSPKELIQIAILSAALERRCFLNEEDIPHLYSKRYEAVSKFLDTALNVVPIESILYATKHDIGHRMHDLDDYNQFPFNVGIHGPKCQCHPSHLKTYCMRLLRSYKDKISLSTTSHRTSTNVYIPRHYPEEGIEQYIEVEDDSSMMSSLQSLVLVEESQNPGYRFCESRVSGPYYSRSRKREVVFRRRPRTSVPKLSGKGIRSLFTDSCESLNPKVMLRNSQKALNDIDSSQADANITVLSSAETVRRDASEFAALVDGFMGTHMQVPLVQSSKEDTAKALESGISTGVWYIVGLNFGNLQSIIKDKQIIIDVTDYLGTFLQGGDLALESEMSTYVGKVQFIATAMSNTVSCSSNYVSYSLEHQLKELCTECGILSDTAVEDIVGQWKLYFKEKILSCVALDHREIIARWIKWLLAIHDLREALASQTTLGVVGLMNSGKSSLMNKLFGKKIPSGTLESKRTTVPFVYNLGPEVEEMDVMDFPGVDDCDDVIRGLCKILFDLAQLVIYMVDYRKAHSDISMTWLKHIAKSGAPTLLCLTFGDQLYAENMGGLDKFPEKKEIKQIVKRFQMNFESKYKTCVHLDPPECMICSIATQNDSVLGSHDAQQKLQQANIKSSRDIMNWIVKTLNRRSQVPLAEKMKKIMSQHV